MDDERRRAHRWPGRRPQTLGRHPDQALQDFELTLDFKIDEHGKYNSGVFLRRPTKKGIGPAYQINIGRGAAGNQWDYLDQWLHKGDEKDAVRKPREWNRLRIRTIGPYIRVWLNEKSIIDFTHKNPPAYLLKPGPIALQTYGAEGHNGWVQFLHAYHREESSKQSAHPQALVAPNFSSSTLTMQTRLA